MPTSPATALNSATSPAIPRWVRPAHQPLYQFGNPAMSQSSGGRHARVLCLRVKGGGSLGRARYVAIAEWRGGHILREAKAIVPSAWDCPKRPSSRPTWSAL
jgi:hypothetical protein